MQMQMQMQMGLSPMPMQSNASLTYDSFWSSHATAGNWRKLVGQGSSGNGNGDATGGMGMGTEGGFQDGAGGTVRASTDGDMSAQSTGLPMNAAAELHG